MNSLLNRRARSADVCEANVVAGNRLGQASVHQLQFGEFLLDRGAQRLLRAGTPVDLDPRAWDVLCYLVDRPGALVSREEMLAAAWSGVAVSDAALSQAVQRVRRTLGDGARRPRYIETVHRRGFRFIATVQIAISEGVESGSGATPVSEPAPFVGREQERQKLGKLLAAARHGRRQVVFVEGDPGIGKSALVGAFLAEHTDRSTFVIRGQCVQQEGTAEPYMVVLEALDHLGRTEPDTIGVLTRHAPTWLAQIPWLLSPDHAHRLRDSVSDATRARMLREMARALEVVGGDRTVVLVLEDLHWADPPTVDLLGSIAQRTGAARLMVVCTYQPARAIVCAHPIVGLARRLWARGASTRIALELFSRAEVHEFLVQRLASPAEVEPLAERLHMRSEGNPLFLVTLVDHLLERGIVAAGTSASLGPEDLSDIPANLRGMIEMHLDSVDAPALEILEAASAAALEFRTASVAAALGMPGPEGIEAVESGCEQLAARWHLLTEEGAETWLDGTRTSRYAFRHDLFRQVLYERLPGNRRRRFHQRIGQRLEEAFAQDTSRVASELAAHFDQSGDDARAASYFLLAARQARHRFADHDAAIHFRAALRRIEGLPEGNDRDLQELQARLGLVRTRLTSEQKRPDDEESNLKRIQTLAAHIPDGRHLFRVQMTLAQIHILRSLPDLARPIIDGLVALAQRGSPSEQVELLFAKGTIAMMQGRFAAACDDSSRALAIYDESSALPGASDSVRDQRWRDAGCRLHVQLGATRLLLGAPHRALEHLQRAIELCGGRIHPSFASGRLLTAAGILCQRGDLDLAQAVSDRGLALAEEHQFENQILIIQPQRLWLSIERGDRKKMVGRIRAAWKDYLRAKDSAAAPVGPVFLLDVCRIVGAVEEGLAIAAKTWEDTRPTGLRWYDAEIERLRGELLLLKDARKKRAEAGACFELALKTAREQGAKWYELRAAMSLLRMHRRRAGESEARDRLERLYSGFTEGFDTPDLRAAAALLGR